jgi:hypothetical protein
MKNARHTSTFRLKSLIYIIGVMLLLTACGQQQRAKSVVKDFMETYQQGDVDYLEFSDVDSTKMLSDSLINALQQQAGKKVSFQKRNSTTLLLIRAKYLLDDDTCSTTFYLDPSTMGVVACKQN